MKQGIRESLTSHPSPSTSLSSFSRQAFLLTREKTAKDVPKDLVRLSSSTTGIFDRVHHFQKGFGQKREPPNQTVGREVWGRGKKE